MIKLDRGENIPKVLTDNAEEWTNNLLSLISKYGSYKAIPKEIKETALKYYRHEDIKDALFKLSHKKCAFCEGFPEDNGNIEVEHFHPKSLYPEEAFKWENFLPCCRKCNNAKDDHDTKLDPIINPFTDNPSDYLEVSMIRLKGKNIIGEKTIDVCNLKGTRLYRPYAELLLQFNQYEDDLLEAITDYHNKDTERRKKNQLLKIQESIDRLEHLIDTKSKYSFFCSNLILKSRAYQDAKELLKNYPH
ncbi:hypothetical protein Q5X61_07290 [Acinetobacter baumannii]|nr:hypothetical protein [Acinetobacter baumannii]